MVSLTKNYFINCKSNLGGVRKLYLFPFVKYSRSLVTVVGNLLVSYPTTLIYEFEFVGNPNVDISQDENDGGKFYNNNITFDLVGLSYAVEIQKLAKKDYIIIFEDENGNKRILGLRNGLVLDSLTSSTGGAKSDLSGFNLSFKGQEEQEPYFINNLANTGFVLDNEPPLIIENYTDLFYTGENVNIFNLQVIGTSSAMCTSRNGDFILVLTVNPDTIRKINLTTPFDLTTAQNVGNNIFDLTNIESTPQEIKISDDGLNVFFSGQTQDRLRRLALPSYGDIENGVLASDFIDFAVLQTPNLFDISPSGQRIVMASGASRLQEYFLTTPFDLNSAILENDLTSFSLGVASPAHLQFLDNGNTLIVSGTTNQVNQFDLLEPYSLNGLGAQTLPAYSNTLTELFGLRTIDYFGDNSQAFGLGRLGGNTQQDTSIIKYNVNT